MGRAESPASEVDSGQHFSVAAYCIDLLFCRGSLRWPGPIPYLGHIVAMLADVLPMLQEFSANPLTRVPGNVLEPRHTLNHHPSKMETAHLIQYGHVKGRSRRAFLFVATHMKVVVIC